MTLEVLKALNPDLEIFDIDDAVFENYGRRITGIDVSELIQSGKQIGFPETGSVYEASNELFEQLPVAVELQDECFGELPIQIGYCYGHNNLLNGLEWHTSSEINVAVTDMVLLLAERKQLSNGTIDSSLVKAFLLKEGDVVEVYATSMHFCPCQVSDEGFGCVVVLPKGTNLTLEKPSRDPLLFRKNKWLISHIDNAGLIAKGVVAGITGTNYMVRY